MPDARIPLLLRFGQGLWDRSSGLLGLVLLVTGRTSVHQPTTSCCVLMSETVHACERYPSVYRQGQLPAGP